MTGYSSNEPLLIEQVGDHYQFRYDLKQIDRSLDDGGSLSEWQYSWIEVPIASIEGDLDRAYAKVVRTERMRTLTVTTAGGKIFDADETSQARMSRALQTAQITGLTETAWVMADNTVVTVTVEEMQEALALSVLAQATVWFI